MSNGEAMFMATFGHKYVWDGADASTRRTWDDLAARYEALKAERDADALALAVRAMSEELDRMKYDKKNRCHRDYVEVTVDELDERMGLLADALAALKGGGK